MNTGNQKRDRRHERGQLLIVLAFVMIGMMLCSALAIDLAFAYTTKARLVKAVDAACLVGMQNLSAQGQTLAGTTASSTFNANYPVTGLDASTPVVNVSFTTNSSQQAVTVTGTATIHTIFLGLLPGYRTLTVNAQAQALRGFLAMSIVLDRSGSMCPPPTGSGCVDGDGGGEALQSAVPTFISYFNNTSDQVAMVSFASNATTDLAIQTQFQTPIDTKVAALSFTGGTFGLGGITLAKAQEDSVVPSQGENLVKVVVYFTDGKVNMVQDTFACTSTLGNTAYIYGGYDSGSNYDFFDTNSNDLSSNTSSCGCSRGSGYGNSSGYGLDCNGHPPNTCSKDCSGVTQFYSQQYSRNESFSRTNITAEAQYRTLQVASALQNEGVYVFAVGLGSDPSTTFLQELANDPASPTYNAALPQGLAVFAPDCPSSSCTQELQQVFQTIAAKVLLRLTE